MMKKLLVCVLPMLFMASTLQAQKTWDFANDDTTWPLTDGIPAAGGPLLIDNLAIYPHSSSDNMAQVDGSSSTFDDGFTGINRFKLNGGGGADPSEGEFIPSVRYLRFSMTGPGNIEIWARSGGSSARTLFVTDGTAVLSESTLSDSSLFFTMTASYSGGAGDIYIFGSNNFSLYKIEVSANVGNTTLSLNSESQTVASTLKAIGNRVVVGNVMSETEIDVYSLTGALIKSVKTNTDTQFNLPNGLYVARLKTATGQKAVKLLTY